MRGRGRAAPGWWLEFIDGYFAALRRRNRRPRTLATYLTELKDFGDCIGAYGLTSSSQLTGLHIEAWQDRMRQRMAPSSQQVAGAALRGCLKWAAKQGLPLSDPRLWTLVEGISVPQLEPRPIPRADVARILQAFDESPRRDILWLRTRALFRLMFSSGARISEALSVPRGPIGNDGVPIRQKGDRPHILVVSEEAKQAIARYDEYRIDHCPAMFASLKPNRYDLPLKPAEAQEGWDGLCVELEIPRFTSHQIRHSTATNMRRLTGDVLLTARHIGHRSLRMMMRYSEVDLDDRRRAVDLLDRFPSPPRIAAVVVSTFSLCSVASLCSRVVS